jgi:hypothetical protein
MQNVSKKICAARILSSQRHFTLNLSPNFSLTQCMQTRPELQALSQVPPPTSRKTQIRNLFKQHAQQLEATIARLQVPCAFII